MSTDKQSTGSQTIVVTGASGDIGLAIVERLIADGFHVAACCQQGRPHQSDLCRPVAGDYSSTGSSQRGQHQVLCVGHHQRKRSYRRAHQQCGRRPGQSGIDDQVSDMRDVFEINLFGPLQFTQYITKKMTRQKSGAIVNITSTAGILGDSGTLAYGGSKAAFAHATRVMATEFGPLGIRVNAVAPSAVTSTMAGQMDAVAREKLSDREALLAKPCHRMLPTWLPICCQTMLRLFRDKS